MLSSVLSKSARDRSTVTLVVAVVLVGFCAMAIAVYSGLGDEVTSLIQDMPDALAAVYGTSDGSAAGIVSGAIFAVMAPLVVLSYTITGSSAAAIGEEQDGSLDLLLMSPVSRTDVLLSKAAVLAMGVVIICASLWLGSQGVGALVGMDFSNQDLLAGSVQLLGLGLMFGFLALAISAVSGRPIGGAVAGGAAGLSYVMATFLPLSSSVQGMAELSPWYLYSGQDPVAHGVDWPGLVAMLAIAAGLLLLGVWGQNRRDLKG